MWETQSIRHIHSGIGTSYHEFEWIAPSRYSLAAFARAMTTDGACISGGTSSGIRRVFLKAVERCTGRLAKVEFRGTRNANRMSFTHPKFLTSFKEKENVHGIAITVVEVQLTYVEVVILAERINAI